MTSRSHPSPSRYLSGSTRLLPAWFSYLLYAAAGDRLHYHCGCALHLPRAPSPHLSYAHLRTRRYAATAVPGLPKLGTGRRSIGLLHLRFSPSLDHSHSDYTHSCLVVPCYRDSTYPPPGRARLFLLHLASGRIVRTPLRADRATWGMPVQLRWDSLPFWRAHFWDTGTPRLVNSWPCLPPVS